MYDRLKCFKYLNLTQGNSVYEVNDAVCSLCKDYLKKEHNIKVDSKKKLNYLTTAFRYLGIPSIYLQSNEKGIYFGFTCKNSKDFLNGTTNKCPDLNEKKYNIKTAQEIYNEWIERWSVNRFNNLKKSGRFIIDNEIINKSENNTQ